MVSSVANSLIQSLNLNLSFDNAAAAKTWLAQQSASVQTVSAVDDAGLIHQHPVWSSSAYVDPAARLIGGMIISEDCFIGPYAVIRLDEVVDPEPLVVGRCTSIQDCAVIHANSKEVGENVIVAHQAVVHGARICNDATLYIQAVADGDNTVIGEGAFLHQGCYVGHNIQIHPQTLVPPGAKILTQEAANNLEMVPASLREMHDRIVADNQAHARRYLASQGKKNKIQNC